MTILELFKKVNPSVLAAKMIFKHLQSLYPVLKISDIADTSSGGTPNRGMIDYYNGDIPWVKSGELKDGLITKCDEFITEAGLKNSSAKLFPKGTLLVAMYGANIGKTGVLDFDATTNQAVCAIFPKVNISNEYLFWYFKQQRIDFIAIGKGGAQPNISQTIINNASIVVPDEKTQKKIVDFLDKIEQENTIDESFFIPDVLKDIEQICNYKDYYVTLTNSFDNQLTLIENLNQAILQEVVQGKLVAQDPTDEPASQLLERIKAEKAKTGKKEKPLPPIKKEEIPFEIPDNWVWCRLGEVLTIKSGKRIHASDYRNGGIPFLRSGEIGSLGRGERVKNELFISTEKYLEIKTKFGTPKQGDILIACIGGSIGNTWVVDEREFYFKDGNLVLLESIPEIITNYLLLYLKTPFFWKNTILNATDSSYNALTIEKLNDAEFPLPPLSEQQRIVAEIEKQLGKTKELKAHIIANQQATEQLLKALLHGAFEV